MEIKFSDIGEGVAEGEIVRWLVREGELVKEDQPLVEIMTDKVNVEIPSPTSGHIVKIIAQENTRVFVGETLVEIAELSTRQDSVSPKPVLPNSEIEPSQILASPSARRLARDLRVDLAKVHGTGPGGRVRDDDVSSMHRLLAIPDKMEERIPLKGIRREIAERMTNSTMKTASVTIVEEVEMGQVLKQRETLKESFDQRGRKLTPLTFIIGAVVKALKLFPYLNAELDETSGDILLKRYYNIGMATATEKGLLVPIIKSAENMGPEELSQKIEEQATKAREGTLQLDDVSDGTFSVTNIGAIGGLISTPIINHPQVAILAVNKIESRPISRHDTISIAKMSYLSLTFDHRVLDGDMAARFLQEIKRTLEQPSLIFA